MSYVSIEGLTKSFGGKPPTTAIQNLDLEIEEGEFVVLLGPSGCGKTTTLRCLAGLERPNAGSIRLGEQTVFDASRRVNLSPDRRSIGMVFQSYALWPHMTVRKNIAYPLRSRGMTQEIKDGRVEATASLVDCEPLLDRFPSQLSGGQQQRVALARGLAAQPDLVLLDEPLSNLDARLRDSVRAQLSELHARLRFTAVLVTHDQSEALALGERLAIMRSGTIEQFDGPRHVFEHPATEYVADFVGMSNHLLCERRGDSWFCNGDRFAGEPPTFPADATKPAAFVRLRPDDVHVAPPTEKPPVGTSSLSARLVGAQYGGRHVDVTVAVGPSRIHARVASKVWDSWDDDLRPGHTVCVSFRADDARVYDEPNQHDAAVPARADSVRL